MAKLSKFSELEDVVADHLTSIKDALRDYQVQNKNDKNSVSEQLETLLSRVRSIEAEALKTKEALEAERHKSHHDNLTGLYNRAAYAERSFHEIRRFKRYHRPLSLAVCDIDLFKAVNDKFGHQIGDKILKIVAKILQDRLRNVDFIARLGGEEFVIIMPETKVRQGKVVLEKIRRSLEKMPFKTKGESFIITVSFGITELTAGDTMDSAFERADRALYEAKSSGRNRTCIEEAKDKKTLSGIHRNMAVLSTVK